MQNYLTNNLELFVVVIYVIVALIIAIYIIITDERRDCFEHPLNRMETIGKVFCISLFWPVSLTILVFDYFVLLLEK